MSLTIAKAFKLSAGLIFALLELSPSNLQTQTASAQPAQSIPNLAFIPKTLEVPGSQQLLLAVAAKGAQIYVCRAMKSAVSVHPNYYEWVLKAPDAVLLNQQGQYLGRHYAGPTWEAKDGSKVVAQVKSKADSQQDSAIPWLLLKARSQEGNGIFSQVGWIQRVNTVGGKAPTQGCDVTTQNREVRIKYSADYFFYGT
jgi:hypothetical protein